MLKFFIRSKPDLTEDMFLMHEMISKSKKKLLQKIGTGASSVFTIVSVYSMSFSSVTSASLLASLRRCRKKSLKTPNKVLDITFTSKTCHSVIPSWL